jgi:ATP synthase I chain
MSQIVDSIAGDEFAQTETDALNRRILRAMIVSVLGSVAVALAFAPWRFTLGLALGGSLSLLNYCWLHSSVAAIINLNSHGQKAKARSSRYLLRYLIVGLIVFAGYQLNLISLPATIAGLSAFVPALMFEALRQFYFVIINREESY